jgi:hypothetical protein
LPIEEQHEALLVYLLSCFARGDWHGVSDAANDLRVMEAVHPELMEIERGKLLHVA